MEGENMRATREDNSSQTLTISADSEKEESLSALAVQRRLELREFFLKKNDILSAGLVDHMFKLAAFKDLKRQIGEIHGSVPKNWETTDRYEKYKEMLNKGISTKRVRQEMIDDGLDPEELFWESNKDQTLFQKLTGRRQSHSSASGVTTSSAPAPLEHIPRRKGKFKMHNTKKRGPKTPKTRRGSKVNNTLRSVGPTLRMEEFEARKDREHLQRLESQSGFSIRTTRTRTESSLPSVAFGRKVKHPKMVRTMREASFESETGGKSSTLRKGKKQDEIQIDERRRSQFLFCADEVRDSVIESDSESASPRKGKRLSNITEALGIAKLTSKNKIGHIHDYKVYFPDTQSTLRKTSVGNIGRKASESPLRERINTMISHLVEDYHSSENDSSTPVEEESEKQELIRQETESIIDDVSSDDVSIVEEYVKKLELKGPTPADLIRKKKKKRAESKQNLNWDVLFHEDNDFSSEAGQREEEEEKAPPVAPPRKMRAGRSPSRNKLSVFKDIDVDLI